jgi:DNA-directed RNA polymerase subunit RPC12/RpoP
MTNNAKHTWVCGTCKKSFRRTKSIKSLRCPHCKRACRLVNWQTPIPSPKRKRQWRTFSDRHLQMPSTKEYYAAILDAQLRTTRNA